MIRTLASRATLAGAELSRESLRPRVREGPGEPDAARTAIRTRGGRKHHLQSLSNVDANCVCLWGDATAAI